jgi:hypothetical protein
LLAYKETNMNKFLTIVEEFMKYFITKKKQLDEKNIKKIFTLILMKKSVLTIYL